MGAVSDERVKKVDILLKEWTLLDNTVTELNSWVAKDKSSEARTSSLWRRWSPPLESSRISSRRRRSSLRTCNLLQLPFLISIFLKRSKCCLRPNNYSLKTNHRVTL